MTELVMLFFPSELIAYASVLAIMVGGACMIVGARKAAMSLIIFGISLPFVVALTEAVFNDFFAMLPEAYIKPVSWLIMGVTYLLMFGVLMKSLFGEKAWDQAKGELLADAIKGLFKLAFSKPLLIVWGVLGLYFWLSHYVS
ncbi:MAG: hypothetical protein IPG66_18495 [Hydrogenophilales bacterium]|nr:hypothetical protein [Hydrogenophilales bacterium]